jgi:hypothetical protein
VGSSCNDLGDGPTNDRLLLVIYTDDSRFWGSDEQQKQLQNAWVTITHYIAYLNTHRGISMSLSVGSSSNNLGDGPVDREQPLIPRAGWMHQPIPPHVAPVVYTATQHPPEADDCC